MTRTIKLQVWDTTGQQRFWTLTSRHSRNAHGSIIVYDMTGKESLNKAKHRVGEIRKRFRRWVKMTKVRSMVAEWQIGDSRHAE